MCPTRSVLIQHSESQTVTRLTSYFCSPPSERLLKPPPVGVTPTFLSKSHFTKRVISSTEKSDSCHHAMGSIKYK